LENNQSGKKFEHIIVTSSSSPLANLSEARPAYWAGGPLLDNMFTVYILQSLKDNKTYVGYTDNFERRFKQHNLGMSKSTKYRSPFKLLFKEDFQYSAEAKKREVWWKSGAGRRKLKEYFDQLQTRKK
jgi:putative endonuclease